MAQTSQDGASVRRATLTVLRGDVEGSTPRWEADPAAMAVAMGDLNKVVTGACQRHWGRQPLEQGEGDSFLLVFESALHAMACAVDLNRALAAPGRRVPLAVRIGIHTGDVDTDGLGRCSGVAINRCARICSLAHGGQVLLSEATRELIVDQLPDDTSLVDLGVHQLRGLRRAERIFQLRHPDLPDAFPAIGGAWTPTNLPAERTTFVGRDGQIDVLAELVAQGGLVTLTGTGGVGKTRLAGRVAASLLERFADGVWFVELAALADAALVPATVASAAAVREQTGRSMEEVLAEAFSRRPVLLVLDNCEHLAEACARLVGRLLGAGVTVLATSREPLRVAGEHLWPVPPLAVPTEAAVASAADVATFEAVALFVERAVEADPRFVFSDEDAPFVASICRRLDGVPLAIELAAARARVLSPRQIADRLGDRFRLLTGRARDAPDRQQTLRAAIDWSHELLDPKEQLVLRRAAIFPAGFTLDAAEEVVVGEDLPAGDVLDLLTGLVYKSLLTVERDWQQARYRFNETTREYAWSRLEAAGEVEPVSQKLVRWAVRLVEEARPHLTGQEQRAWLDRLHAEIDNLRAALVASFGAADAAAALSLASGPLRYWMVRGSWSEGQHALTAALALDAAAPPSLRLDALRSAGVLADLVSDYDVAASYHETQLALARDLRDQKAVADALLSLARNAYRRGELGRARPLALEAVALLQVVGDREALARGMETLAQADPTEARQLMQRALLVMRHTGDAEAVSGLLMRLGGVLALEGDLTGARASLAEGLQQARDIGYTRYIARCTQSLGELAFAEGDIDRAQALVEEAQRLWPVVGHRNALAEVIRDLANLAFVRGDLASASSGLEEALARFRELGMKAHEGWTLGDLALLALRRGDLDASKALLAESLSIAASLPDALGVGQALDRLAAVRLARGDAGGAARLTAAAEAIRTKAGIRLPPLFQLPVDDVVAAAREILGPEAFAAAQAEGAATPLDDLVVVAGGAPSGQAGGTIAQGGAPASTQAAAIFRRDGDFFTIAYAGPPMRIKDCTGLRYIATLLARPDVEVHCLELAGGAASGGAGVALDAQAKRAYRARLEDLREELHEAEDFNDGERVARVREEMEFLALELARAVGLGGGDRRVADAAERARQNVTRAIRRSIRHIDALNPALGRLLDTTIVTGAYCRYRPDTRFAVTWVL